MAMETAYGQDSNPWLQGLDLVRNQKDIDALLDAKVPEGERLEFKRELSARQGRKDPWATDKKLSEAAKKQILHEVIAFANAYGGTLLLGIAETESKPPVADRVVPIPHCEELAERWRLVFRDSVEPPVPQLQIHAVSTDGDAGVVVFQVGRSPMAPHRVKPTLECPIRRADRCESMTMREIQDMCVNTARGLERLERQLKIRAQRFQYKEIAGLQNPESYVGIRMTAVPVVDTVAFNIVFHHGQLTQALAPQWRSVQVMRGTTKEWMDMSSWRLGERWRPMLRAARSDYLPANLAAQSYPMNGYCEVHCDGLLELGYVSNCNIDPQNPDTQWIQEKLFISWMPNLLAWVDQVRCQAQVPMAEYVLEVEITVRGKPFVLVPESPNALWSFGLLPTSPPQVQQFPLYPFRQAEDGNALTRQFWRDLWHWLGQNINEETSFTLVLPSA
ncbi:MAG: ATP-binding protein [Caldilineaceae bacterium SB0664_bin_22]|nr:ATP-binding protein [Caldilineaceae bacterium SB0664_bin_22]